MMHLTKQLAVYVLLSVVGAPLAVVGCSSDDSTDVNPTGPTTDAGPDVADSGPTDPGTTPLRERLTEFEPLPTIMATTPPSDAQIALGKQLYFDKRLSKNQDISCNSCHQLNQNGNGADTGAVSDGTGIDPETGKPPHGDRNSPTVYNAALHLFQFWDGRAQTVEEQALGPILNPVEMGMPDEDSVLAVVNSIPDYVTAFWTAFPVPKDQDPGNIYDPVTYANIGNAIGAFERTLVTPSAWDQYLKGDDTALTSAELAGLTKFLDTGCDGCHNGVAVGGRDFTKFGVISPWSGASGDPDIGREHVTNNPFDHYVFKVPSLRNIEKTAPYFHNGTVNSLNGAVKAMASTQLGKSLSDADTASIVTFLKSLTSTLPLNIDPPTLPPDADGNPAPDPNN